jgi:hypothetical protein
MSFPQNTQDNFEKNGAADFSIVVMAMLLGLSISNTLIITLYK